MVVFFKIKKYFVLILLLGVYVIAKNPEEVVDKEGNTLLHMAVMHQKRDIVKKLLESNKSVEVDQKNYKGKTALHMAVERNDIPIVQLLLDHKATVNVYDIYQFTPLYYAKYYKYFRLVNLLQHYGAVEEKRVVDDDPLVGFIKEFNCVR